MHSPPIRPDRLDSTEAEAAVLAVTERLLDDATDHLERQDIEDTHDLYDMLGETPFDDTLAVDLSLDDRLSLAEQYADDYGFELGEVEIAHLRSRIETLAILVIHQLGLERAHEHLSALLTAMEEHGLSISQLRSNNPHGWARHYAERDEGSFQVYQYRNLEGEKIHVDLYEYHAIPGQTFYFEVPVSPEDVRAEENYFDAA